MRVIFYFLGSEGYERFGSIELSKGHISFENEKLRGILESKVRTEEGEWISFDQDRENYIRSLPRNYNGSYVKAVFDDENGEDFEESTNLLSSPFRNRKNL